MINKLIKNFNTPLAKYKQDLIKTSTLAKFNSIYGPLGWKESQISFILKSFFRKIFIIISNPVYSINSNTIKITFLYYIPNSIIPIKSFLSRKGDIGTTSVNSLFVNYGGIYPAKTGYVSGLNEKSTQLKMSSLYLNQFNKLLNDSNSIKNTPGQGIGTGLSNDLSVSSHETYKLREEDLKSKMKFISILLSKVLRTHVLLEATRIKYPQFDSQILSEYLGLQSFSWTYGKMKKSIRILSIRTTQFFKDEKHLNEGNDLNLITGLTGVSFKLSGRLQKQRIVPRQTIKRTNKGPSAPNKNMAVQTAIFTGKNKKGTYSIKIQTGHSLRNKILKAKG